MLFSRFLFFSLAIERLIKLIPKLFLAIIYLFLTGVILIFFAEPSLSAIKETFQYPASAFKYLYAYFKWFYYNFSAINFMQFTELLLALASPYLCLHLLKKIFKFSLRKLIIAAKLIFNRTKDHSSASTNYQDLKNLPVNKSQDEERKF